MSITLKRMELILHHRSKRLTFGFITRRIYSALPFILSVLSIYAVMTVNNKLKFPFYDDTITSVGIQMATLKKPFTLTEGAFDILITISNCERSS